MIHKQPLFLFFHFTFIGYDLSLCRVLKEFWSESAGAVQNGTVLFFIALKVHAGQSLRGVSECVNKKVGWVSVGIKRSD